MDLTTRHEILSLMDGFFGYNQIKIVEEDQHKMTFIIPWGNFFLPSHAFLLEEC